MKAKSEEVVIPQNKVQKLALEKGYRTAYAFGKAIEAAGIASYGTAHAKWMSGEAGDTKHKILLGIARFLGANTVEEVFE